MATQETANKGIFAAKVELQPTGQIADKTAAVVSVTVVDSQAGNYVTGEAIQLRATFDEVVKLTAGAGPVYPRIPITLTSGTVYAVAAAQASPTNIINFSYTVQGGDAATATHVAIGSPIQLNTGTINDMVGQAATLTFTPPTTTSFTVN